MLEPWMMLDVAGQPEQYPGQVQREAAQTLEKLGRERYAFLSRQIQAGIEAAVREEDGETMVALRDQLLALAERHRELYPPVSPYFRDSRSPVQH